MISAVLPDIPGRPEAIMFATAMATTIGQERLQGDRVVLSTQLNLIFPDNALLPVRFALDPVLKHVICFRKLSDYLVTTFAFAVSPEIGRKVQGLPDGKFVRCHVLLQ